MTLDPACCPDGAPLPPEEAARLQTLHSLGLLDTSATPAVEALTRLVRAHFDVQTCTVSLVDAERQWFHAVAGELAVRETPRRDALCAWTVREDRLLVVPDTWQDPRFAQGRLVQGPPFIRFYAGAPLRVQGQLIGTLCIFDPRPRALDEAERRLLQGMAEAIAALLEAQQLQREALAMGQLLASAVEEAYLFDLDRQQILYATPGAAQRLGSTSTQLRQLPPTAISPLYTREQLNALPLLTDAQGGHRSVDTEHHPRQGGRYAVSSLISPAPQVGPGCVVVVARNIEERLRSERELARLAHHDALTGLANRYLLEDRFVSARERGQRQAGWLALIVIDLDGFKGINDRLGHQAGDAVLVHVAAVLQAWTRGGDTVARTGGDEFVVLLDGLHSPAEAQETLQRLREALARERCAATGAPVAASLGLAVGEAASATLEALFTAADAAMYADKGARKR